MKYSTVPAGSPLKTELFGANTVQLSVANFVLSPADYNDQYETRYVELQPTWNIILTFRSQDASQLVQTQIQDTHLFQH